MQREAAPTLVVADDAIAALLVILHSLVRFLSCLAASPHEYRQLVHATARRQALFPPFLGHEFHVSIQP